jgi:glycogen debranching enzyme
MLRALARVLSPTGFPYGSNGRLFGQAQFGRDSLEVAEDLLAFRPDIARVVIERLAALQGTLLDRQTEEEPGKIHHEYRSLAPDGEPLDPSARDIFFSLARGWELAETEDELAALRDYVLYPTVDATPLYVRLIARYCAAYGGDILRHEYTPRRWTAGSGRPTIGQSVFQAVEWIAGHLERSDLGLLEFQRMTSHGHPFQAWKDGGTSYLHPDGRYANYNGPIASIEVQGLAYDALTAAPGLLPTATDSRRDQWWRLADNLQRAVLEIFWMPGESYFAMAIDREPGTGAPRQVKTLTSNPGELLDSGIFDTLPPELVRSRVAPIVRRLYSDEFLTPAGIRSSSLAHRAILDYPAYQGSYTVWHKDTYDVAKGFRRQGFHRLAKDLENRLLNAVNITGAPTEFLYVMPDNHVDYRPFDREGVDGAVEIAGTNVPENDQAWTISAALAIKWSRGRRLATAPTRGWQWEEEKQIWKRIRPVEPLRTKGEIERAAAQAYRFRINTVKGWERERAHIREHGL